MIGVLFMLHLDFVQLGASEHIDGEVTLCKATKSCFRDILCRALRDSKCTNPSMTETPRPAQQPGQPGFENDAPQELTRAGTSQIMCQQKFPEVSWPVE